MTKQENYNPRPAPLRGPKRDQSTFSDTHSEAVRKISIHIPKALADLALSAGRKVTPDTNLHEVTTAALRWFLERGQYTDWGYSLFIKRTLVVGDMPALWVSETLTEELQETALNQHLETLSTTAVEWFLKQPTKQTFLWFKPLRLTFLSRDNMVNKIDKFITEARAYAKANGYKCAITKAGVVTTAIREYLRYYLSQKEK